MLSPSFEPVPVTANTVEGDTSTSFSTGMMPPSVKPDEVAVAGAEVMGATAPSSSSVLVPRKKVGSGESSLLALATPREEESGEGPSVSTSMGPLPVTAAADPPISPPPKA